MDKTISHKHRLTIMFRDLPLKETMDPRKLSSKIRTLREVIKLKMATIAGSVKGL